MSEHISNEEVKKANKELHDIEASYYDMLHSEIWNFYEQLQTRRDLRKVTKILSRKPLQVLDVGAGTGNLTLKFWKAGSNVTAVDISEEMLKALCAKISDAFKDRVELICEDIDKLLLKQAKVYDVVCFSSVLHHLPDYYYTLELAISKLRNGGIIYITHEPSTSRNRNSFILRNRRRLLSLIDWRLNRLHLIKYSNLKTPALDYSRADVHAHSKEGINPKEVLQFLKRKNMEIVFCREYANYKSGIISLLGNLFLDANKFKLVARKHGGQT